MESTKLRIKEFVSVLYTGDADEVLLDFLIDDVVERFLVFTNRTQLVTPYLEAIEEGKDYSPLPVPVEVERTLSRAVVNLLKTTNTADGETDREIVQLNDNGQSVRYSEKAKTAFASAEDGVVFQGVMPILQKYILPSIIENPPRFQKSNKGRFLRQRTGGL